jgi:hypothetical protein
VRGNVICGGLTKMIYRADWSALDSGVAPLTPLGDEQEVVDEMDFADVLSERYHGYRIDGAPGFVAMKLLARSEGIDPSRGLWDAGRVVPPGATVHFSLSGVSPGSAASLWVRTAPSQRSTLKARVDGVDVGSLVLAPVDGWHEASIAIPKERVRPRMDVELAVEGKELVVYHLWGVEKR